ncbi:MAG: rhodanese-like domain-containing protein [Opitutae bacterium]
MPPSCLRYFSLLGFLLSATLGAADVAKITPAAAAALVAAHQAVLVDVREPAEWAETGVVTGAVLLPKSDFDGPQKGWKEFLAHTGDQQIILYCRSGKRAGVLGEALAAQGFKTANAGGYKDWEAAGLPVKKIDPVKK